MKIAHLADIHIQDRRRAEYAAVFADLYASLRAEGPDAIVVAGDVFDNKMRASAHNLADVAAFLESLADVAPVVLIAGNHDTNCLTPGALDLLTPLLADRRALQPPRLTYFRESGVYETAVAGRPVRWTVLATDGVAAQNASALNAERSSLNDNLDTPLNICLFHEEVNGAALPAGAALAGFRLSLADLAPFDAAIGGHIHLRQMLSPRAAYCGSLVQQNIGEALRGHGYLLWSFPAAGAPTARGVDIPNRLGGFLRVEVDAAGADVTPDRALCPAPLYWEVVHDARCPAAALAAAVAAGAAQYGMPPRAVRPLGRVEPAPEAPQEPLADFARAQDAAFSLASHEEIIRGTMRGAALCDDVVAMHRRHMGAAAGAGAGARVRLLRLEFDDMFSFGPGNAVDFTRLERCVSGIVAPNHAGKSSLIEVVLFALYEEHPRAATKAELIRAGATSCRLALDFEVDGRPGRIEKAFDHGKARASRYRLWYAGEDRTQGGTPETLREIRALVGDAPAALAASFQLQGGEHAGFIAARPAERKRLVAEVLSLGAFADIERATAAELTAANATVRALAGQFQGRTVAALDAALVALESHPPARCTAALREAEAAASEAVIAAAVVSSAVPIQAPPAVLPAADSALVAVHQFLGRREWRPAVGCASCSTIADLCSEVEKMQAASIAQRAEVERAALAARAARAAAEGSEAGLALVRARAVHAAARAALDAANTEAMRLAHVSTNIALTRAARDREASRAEAAAAAQRTAEVLKAYRNMLKPGDGIADVLLERARPLITQRINESLRELGGLFEIEITPEFGVNHAALTPSGTTQWLAATLASGYQRFVLSLAARLAFWRLARAPCPDALVIDEGFGSCDDEYLDRLAGALEALAGAPGAPRLVFVVSHVDALKSRLERALEILRVDGHSLLAADVPAVPAAPAVPAVPASTANWCAECNCAVTPARAARHAASAKHSAAMRKTARASTLASTRAAA